TAVSVSTTPTPAGHPMGIGWKSMGSALARAGAANAVAPAAARTVIPRTVRVFMEQSLSVDETDRKVSVLVRVPTLPCRQSRCRKRTRCPVRAFCLQCEGYLPVVQGRGRGTL